MKRGSHDASEVKGRNAIAIIIELFITF
jgi:hypothetical protein